MPLEKFTLELDREEALMMVFLASSSGTNNSRVQRAVEGVAAALREGDRTLHTEQVELWRPFKRDIPLFDLSAGPEVDE